ncbi:MAG: hypothetical protein F4043_04970 [Gammaproteobacteria bacterium]|nr:hypothetical protein [Gammaproteobacteria bacterium]
MPNSCELTPAAAFGFLPRSRACRSDVRKALVTSMRYGGSPLSARRSWKRRPSSSSRTGTSGTMYVGEVPGRTIQWAVLSSS